MRAFEYRDLLVALWWDPTPGFFTARAWEEFGRSTPPVQIQLPFYDRQFVSYVDQLDQLNSKQLQYVGARLFDSLFQGDILRLYLHLREQARPAGSKVRLRLRLDPDIAARLPWECLYDTRHDSFLLNSDETTLVRYVDHETEPPSVAVRLPLRVLLVAVCPVGSKHADPMAREARAIREAIRPLESEGLVTLREEGTLLDEDAVTRKQLERLVDRDVDVLHLVAHCRWEEERAQVAIVDEQGSEDALTSAEFASFLEGAGPGLVVLNGGVGTRSASPELAQKLLRNTPALLIHSGVSTEDLVVRFAESFYRALAELKPVDTALSDARSDVMTHFPLESGWLAPALFLSRKDARVFYNEARERVQQVYQLSEGRYRRKLRETLNRIWPKPERYTKQLLRWMPRQEPLTSLMQTADFLGQPRAAAELVDRFQRLLLIGDAGGGKTMTLYRLFYEAAQPILSYSAKSPLPMYVSLPELSRRTNLVDFVADGLDRELFLNDLEEGRFLFLMDSLDGLSAATTKRLSASLNEFMRRYPMNRFLVAARGPVPFSLDIPNRVELLPFAEWDAMDFLIGDRAMRAEPAQLLYRQLSQYLGVKVGNPQVLTMARRLWREGASIPKTLSGLYMAFYQVAGSSLAPELREGLLPRLALFMSQAGRMTVTRKQLEREARGDDGGLPHGLELEQMTLSEADDLLTELSKTRLLRGPNAFGFPNLGLQEFLTGVALRSWSVQEIMKVIAPAQWTMLPDKGGRPYNLCRGAFHGALPFLSGFCEDSSELIAALLGQDLLLATECYHEAKNKTGTDDLLRAAIQHAVTHGDDLLQKVGCLSLEARADRWAVGVLERLAADPSFTSRAQALEALGRLRSHRSLGLLQAAAREKDPSVSRAALDALSRIKAS